jgi:penicillin-binding protein 1C
LGLQGIQNVAVLVVDNESFDVLAYVGNSQWSVAKDTGYAVDVIHRPRSSGSVLKPFLFAAMLQAGEILPTTLVADVPTQYAGYMPENFDRTYRGAVPAQDALARSLNVPAVRMLKRHGVARFYDFLEHAGMTTLIRSPEEYGLTLILGGAEATLWDLTGMYANLAAVARHTWPGAPAPQRKLKWLQREDNSTNRQSEIGPAAAWLTLNALLEVSRPGDESFWQNFASSRKIAWKTGTSFGHRDAWAIGTTSAHTVAVWVGNATGEGRSGLTGATAAAPVLFDIFNRLDRADWFPQPYLHMKEIEICRNDGYLPNGNCETESQWVPRDSHFDQLSPNNRLVHLDSNQRFRVHGECESPGSMVHRSWFMLSPRQEFYYRKHHAEYRSLPPFRRDCLQIASAQSSSGPMAFLYPNKGTRLYIPLDLAGKKGQTVFEAVHRRPEATLFWHLDNRYLGSTSTFHQQALDIEPGVHIVTVVDDKGYRLARRFEVLGRE